MKNPIGYPCALLMSVVLFASAQLGSAAEPGFKSLFNGKDVFRRINTDVSPWCHHGA